MKMKIGKWRSLAFVFLIGLAACHKDEPAGVGTAEIQMTDAPSDDASIKSVFVTVTAVRVDGKAISGFNTQTIDLKAYQEGNVTSLGTTQLASGTHGQITFVLDVDHDANGNTPGCYVQTVDNAKYKLGAAGNIEVTVAKTWNLTANATTTIVADFDVRKSIRWSADNTIRYAFVNADNLNASVRVVDKAKAGMVSGTYAEQNSSNADKIIVYAYKKGTFNAATETQAQGDDAIYFKNAVSSAEVKGTVSQTFKIAYLEDGDYEFHFAAYSKDAATSRFTFQNLLNAQVKVNGSVADFVTVSGTATVSISSLINL
ncbi:MAG TPA: DUF4382 domain-containing protein [Cyclobacteriaceae bacterium]|jgi:hypothetical protein|nr:DUF4382 domain-containing protein [Cyclobacteriaceae bacterium]